MAKKLRDLTKGNIGPQTYGILKRYGLLSLKKWAADSIIQGKSQDQILLELYDRPEFRERFPAIFTREDNDLPPISVEDYLNYESTASQLGKSYGLQLSQSEVNKLIANDVSPQELETRFTIAATAVFDATPETRAELGRLWNINPGDMMRYWMNPKATLPKLQQQYRMGEIAGAALRTGYGQIEEAAAQRLYGAGFDEQRAMEGFTTLATMRQLFQPISGAESIISREEQTEFLAGDVEAARAIEQRVRERMARFSGSAGFTVGREGFTTGTAR